MGGAMGIVAEEQRAPGPHRKRIALSKTRQVNRVQHHCNTLLGYLRKVLNALSAPIVHGHVAQDSRKIERRLHKAKSPMTDVNGGRGWELQQGLHHDRMMVAVNDVWSSAQAGDLVLDFNTGAPDFGGRRSQAGRV